MPAAKGTWSTAEIAGHSLDVFMPGQRNPYGYALIYLHGVHQNSLRDQSAFVEQFDLRGLPVVCPAGGRCWWVDRLCPDFDRTVTPESYLVHHVLPWMHGEMGCAPPAIGLLGTSMGGQGVLRMSYRYPNRFPVCAALSPAIDFQQRITEGDEILAAMYDDPESARQDTAILHVHPLNWPRHQFFCCDPADVRWYDSADRLRMKLHSLGIPFQCDLETSGGGHGFAYYNRMAPKAIEFLSRALDQERMRIH
jgi:hypothetical protein